MTVSPQENLNTYWSGRAPAYDDYQQRPERVDLDRAAWGEILAGVLPAAPADVLDLGTGSGFVAMVLASLGHRVTATDLADGMIERAREHAARVTNPPAFSVGDAVDPDFAPGSFDAITNRYLMWTLREPEQALTRWRRLLRPGGVLAIVDATWFAAGLVAEGSGADAVSDFERSYDDVVRAALPLAEARSIDATRALVEGAGFRDVTVTPLTSIHDLDREHGVAPGHEVQLQHLVRGVA